MIASSMRPSRSSPYLISAITAARTRRQPTRSADASKPSTTTPTIGGQTRFGFTAFGSTAHVFWKPVHSTALPVMGSVALIELTGRVPADSFDWPAGHATQVSVVLDL